MMEWQKWWRACRFLGYRGKCGLSTGPSYMSSGERGGNLLSPSPVTSHASAFARLVRRCSLASPDNSLQPVTCQSPTSPFPILAITPSPIKIQTLICAHITRTQITYDFSQCIKTCQILHNNTLGCIHIKKYFRLLWDQYLVLDDGSDKTQ